MNKLKNEALAIITFAVIALCIWHLIKSSPARRTITPMPTPEAINYLEWRAPMPSMHKAELEQVLTISI